MVCIFQVIVNYFNVAIVSHSDRPANFSRLRNTIVVRLINNQLNDNKEDNLLW